MWFSGSTVHSGFTIRCTRLSRRRICEQLYRRYGTVFLGSHLQISKRQLCITRSCHQRDAAIPGSANCIRRIVCFQNTKGISTGSPVRKSTTGISTGKTAATTSSAGAAGRWSMQFSDGRSVYLELYQSGARFFGRGSTTLGKTTQGALASGSVSGNKMTVDLITESGTELYSMSMDLSRLDLASKYTVYRYGAQPGYGTVQGNQTSLN